MLRIFRKKFSMNPSLINNALYWVEGGQFPIGPPIGRPYHYFFLAFFMTSSGIGISYLDNCSII